MDTCAGTTKLTRVSHLIILVPLEIVFQSDLDQCSVKGIRKTLETEEGRNFDEEKEFFSQAVMTALESRVVSENATAAQTGEDAVASDYEVAQELQQAETSKSRMSLRSRTPAMMRKYAQRIVMSKNKTADKATSTDGRRRNTLNKAMLLSEELQAVFDGQYTELPRSECVKMLWTYIKSNGLQDPKDKREIICDARLFAIFKKQRVNCFKMHKVLSLHMRRKSDVLPSKDDNDAEDEDEPEAEEVTSSEPSARKRQKKGAERDDESEYGAEEAAYCAEQMPGAAPHEIVHPRLLIIPGVSPYMSFGSVQAAILAYTQVKKMRDPKNSDRILLKKRDPISRLMEKPDASSVHILELLAKVQELYESHEKVMEQEPPRN